MKATPRMTANAVRANRSLCAARLLMLVLHMALVPEAFHSVKHTLGGRVGHLVDDAAVGEEHDALGVAGRDRVMGDHHDGLSEIPHRRAHEGEYLGAGARIEIARWLIGENDL